CTTGVAPGCDSLSSPESRQEGKPNETPLVHHAPRRRGRVAARGACAAAYGQAAHRCPYQPWFGRPRITAPHSKGGRNWAGLMAATCGLTTAGAPATRTATRDMRPNWLRSLPP